MNYSGYVKLGSKVLYDDESNNCLEYAKQYILMQKEPYEFDESQAREVLYNLHAGRASYTETSYKLNQIHQFIGALKELFQPIYWSKNESFLPKGKIETYSVLSVIRYTMKGSPDITIPINDIADIVDPIKYDYIQEKLLHIFSRNDIMDVILDVSDKIYKLNKKWEKDLQIAAKTTSILSKCLKAMKNGCTCGIRKYSLNAIQFYIDNAVVGKVVNIDSNNIFPLLKLWEKGGLNYNSAFITIKTPVQFDMLKHSLSIRLGLMDKGKIDPDLNAVLKSIDPKAVITDPLVIGGTIS